MPGDKLQPVLADRLNGLSESATLALNARAKQMAAEGKAIYNLTAGELASDTPDYIQQAVVKTLAKNKYTPVAGLPELREAIAAHARDFYDQDWIEPANVVVTAGAKPAIFAALLCLINPGDEVIVPVPAWTVSYRPLIELAGGKVVEVPLNEDFDLNVTNVMAAVSGKTRAIIINSPGNPTGGVYSKPALEQLAARLQDTDITVIADDIYSKLVFTADFTPAPSIGFKNLIIVNGFSKSQALTGWRIGYLIAGKPVATAATSLLSHITGNAPLPGQYAALAAMERQDVPPAETLDALKKRRQIVSEALDSIYVIKHQLPAGAFYFFLDLRGVTNNSIEWCERLLTEKGVALVPGEAFGAPGFARLTFAADETTLQNALGLIKDYAEGR
jgi:aspartate aminotransferase